MGESALEMIRVEVAHARPERQLLLSLEVPVGTTLMQAVDLSGIREAFPGLVVDAAHVGIFGRKAPPDRVLEQNDRIEIYRPLIADPKEARRARAIKNKSGLEPGA